MKGGGAVVTLLPPLGAVSRGRLSPVLMVSVLAHLCMILLLVWDGRHPPSVGQPQEIPVELVPAMPAQKPADAAKPKASAQPAVQKPEQAKPAHKADDNARARRDAQRAADARKAQEAKEARRAEAKEAAQERKAQDARDAQERAKEAQARAQKTPSSESVEQRMERLIGPMAAIPLPATAADGTESATYKQIVLSQVAKAKKVGRYQGVPGATSVAFTVADDGTLAHCEIVGHSADPSLDAEALAMVRRAAPFPAPPPGARRDFVIGLRFQAMPAQL